MEWYKVKEKSAGRLRLKLTWLIYRYLGKRALRFVIYFVALLTYIFNSDLRKFTFKHILNYSYSLIDKIEVFSGNFNTDLVEFEDENMKNQLYYDIFHGGVFCIFSHVGNIDVMRSFITKDENVCVSIFMERNHCRMFREFLNDLKIKQDNLKTYSNEDIDLTTSCTVQKSLQNDDENKGGAVFMAGDRPSKEGKTKEYDFFDKKIDLPIGVFRFARMLKTNIYFITCLEDNGKYKVYLDKTKPESDNEKDFIKHLERTISIDPFQFYRFYDDIGHNYPKE